MSCEAKRRFGLAESLREEKARKGCITFVLTASAKAALRPGDQVQRVLRGRWAEPHGRRVAGRLPARGGHGERGGREDEREGDREAKDRDPQGSPSLMQATAVFGPAGPVPTGQSGIGS